MIGQDAQISIFHSLQIFLFMIDYAWDSVLQAIKRLYRVDTHKCDNSVIIAVLIFVRKQEVQNPNHYN